MIWSPKVVVRWLSGGFNWGQHTHTHTTLERNPTLVFSSQLLTIVNRNIYVCIVYKIIKNHGNRQWNDTCLSLLSYSSSSLSAHLSACLSTCLAVCVSACLAVCLAASLDLPWKVFGHAIEFTYFSSEKFSSHPRLTFAATVSSFILDSARRILPAVFTALLWGGGGKLGEWPELLMCHTAR